MKRGKSENEKEKQRLRDRFILQRFRSVHYLKTQKKQKTDEQE